MAKIKKKKGQDEEAKKPEERSDLFESKHVKSIIETFNNVINVIDQEEKELNEFVKDEVPSDDEEEEQ